MQSKLDALLEKTRYQLFYYPQTSVQQDMKYYAKRLLRPENNPPRDRFFWPQAMLAQALESAGDVKTLQLYYDDWLKKGQKIYNIDNVMNGYSLLYVYEKTGEEKYKRAVNRLYIYLKQYREDMGGIIPYRKTHPTHIYADGIGMIVPFLCRYGKMFDNRDATEMAVNYVKEFWKNSMDTATGLPYHGYDAITGVKYGIIGWGRAVGWLMLGLEDGLDYLPEGEEKKVFAKALKELMHSARQYLREDGYFSWQLSAMEGPRDTSATAMIAYALGKWLVPEDATLVKMKGALKESFKNGEICQCSGECNGFSEYPQNYGAYPWSLAPTVRFLLQKYEPYNI